MSDLKRKILAAVQVDLEAIETALAENLKPHLDLVRDVAGHILFSGGKRLRPLLMVLSARACDYTGGYDKTFSTALEYLHAATLLHDDLVDGASLRRGKPAAYLKWGNPIAVLTGDFLLARALSVSAATGSVRIVQILAELTEQMSQGEVHQLMRKGDIRLAEDEYLDVIRRKTAVLFEAACRVSAVLAGAPKEKEAALAQFGFNLGVQAADREWLVGIIRNPQFSAEDFRRVVDLLGSCGAIRYAEQTAEKYIAIAKKELSVFPPSATLETLVDIADYALHRHV